MEYKVKNLLLCEFVWNSDSNIKMNKIDIIMENIKKNNSFSESQLTPIRDRLVNSFLPQYNKMWKSVSRKRHLFLQKYDSFLKKDFQIQFDVSNIASCKVISRNKLSIASGISKRGRPRLFYNEGSTKTKRRRIEDLASKYSEEELSGALQLKKKLSLDDSGSSTNSEDYENNVDIMNILAMYVDLGLTKRKYEKLRSHNAIINPNYTYPNYATLAKSKDSCYPKHIKASDLGANVHFISLLDHTIKRILKQVNREKLENFRDTKLLLIGKWGMDGASGQQNMRQQWITKLNLNDSYDEASYDESENETTTASKQIADITDASVFMISFVPLLLRTNNIVIWENKTPNSPNFCRPIKFQFVKENDLLVRKEYRHYTKLLEKVKTYILEYEGMSFEVSFDIRCTMVDGKVCNILTRQKASTRCNICGVGPKLVNNLSHVNILVPNVEYYKFGLSTLHCWIRFMEYLLHISYNMEFQKGSARSKEEKESKKRKKAEVQKALKKLSITVDIVKQGAGTTNTGNVARTFFTKAESVAAATGLSEMIIKRFHHILQTLTCGKKVDCIKFNDYCLRTSQLCVDLYPWYKLPPSVHKVLHHGSKIIETFELPIGWYSEEPQEANNKVFRKTRAEHSRMCNREDANVDIMHHMHILSDPVISSLRIKEKKHKKELLPEAEMLLLSD